MFFKKGKAAIKSLTSDLTCANDTIDALQVLNNNLTEKLERLEGDSFKYKVTKALLDDDEAILELLEDTLLAAAKKDIAKGIDIRSNKSFFYRLVNEQANKVVTMFNNGEIVNDRIT